jgi:hypothetical protein
MRFIDIRGNIQVPVSNEESTVLEMVRDSDEPFPSNRLNLREKEVARNLVHKGVLDRVLIDEKTHYVYNDLEDFWR